MVLITFIKVLFVQIPFYTWSTSFCENHFLTIPSQWRFINPYTQDLYINCGGKDVYGGSFYGGSQFIGSFINLPIHTIMRVNLTIYYIRSWDNETLTLKLDNKYYYYSKDYYTERYYLCGSASWKDDFEKVSIIQHHNTDTFTVNMRVNLDSLPEDESFGFRDFSIELDVYNFCAELYSECNYQGQVIKICNRIPNLNRNTQPTQIKSVKVPTLGRVILKSQNYGTLELTQDANCINKFNFPKYKP